MDYPVRGQRVDRAKIETAKGMRAEREAILVASGFRVIRFRNEEVETNIESVLARIAEAVGPTPPPLPSREGGQGG